MKPGAALLQAEEEALRLVSSPLASHYGIFPLHLHQNVLCLAVPSGLTAEDKETLRIVLGRTLEFVECDPKMIELSIAHTYGLGAGVVETLVRGQDAAPEEETFLLKAGGDGDSDAGLIEWVNRLIEDAIAARASDIHIEPFESNLRVRYRVDGLLQEARMPGHIHTLAQSLISRIKIMSRLDIGERRLPQDGRIKVKRHADILDLRVSVVPSAFGEAVVIRILKPLALLQLADLGFDEKNTLKIRGLLQKPHGVVLVTGPTGSGKTTTLYACLKELNSMERKIITIEDPIEYKLPGVLQMQVHTKAGLTFAKALRSILRHDPDCIMIGEIRDSETAEIAIRAALTGHLVFSTLHTNDAPSAAVRLIEMGIEPYLAASSLRGVIAQRLVRRFCRRCPAGHPEMHCPECGGKGFYGRLAISEIMTVNETLEDLILAGGSGSALRKVALMGGMESLYEDGLAKVRAGKTSQSEVERVISH